MEIIDFGKNRINAIISKSNIDKDILLDSFTSLNEQASNVYKIEYMHNLNFTVKEKFYSNKKYSNKKCIDSLIMVGLTEEYLDRKINTLSTSELSKIIIASTLIQNKKILVFNNPTIGLTNKDKNKFIKILRMLKNKYNKTIVIASNDVDWLFSFVDYYYLLDRDKIIYEAERYEFYNNKQILKDYKISLPRICQFKNMVYNKMGIKLMNRNDINDLIKDIYRNKN